jgi:hypothetical protein
MPTEEMEELLLDVPGVAAVAPAVVSTSYTPRCTTDVLAIVIGAGAFWIVGIGGLIYYMLHVWNVV